MSREMTTALALDFLERTYAVHVLRVSSDGTIEDCNEAAARNLGAPGEIVGQPIARFLTETDARRLHYELTIPGKRDEPILLNFSDADNVPYSLDCWLDVDGAGASIVGEPPLKHDQRLQRELLSVSTELAVLSRQRARLFEAEARARADAEAASREKDRALATIVHELRQPLAPMRFALGMLTAEDGSRTNVRAQLILERQLAQVTRLIEDLLDAVRIREGKLSLYRQHVDLREVLLNVLEDAHARTTAAGLELECTLPERPVQVHGDAARLRQVFSNILDNAIKYTHRGGRIFILMSIEERVVSVSIRDNGRGIAHETLPRVFQLFGQAAQGERGGLGIGLSVAAGIVSMHGGTIDARSKGIGHGSEFVVSFPLGEQPPLGE